MQSNTAINTFLTKAEKPGGGHIDVSLLEGFPGPGQRPIFKVNMANDLAFIEAVVLTSRTVQAARMEITALLAEHGWQPTERWDVRHPGSVVKGRRFCKVEAS